LDRILPKSRGGSDGDQNLALDCHRCNERHYNFTTGIDPDTQKVVQLFNPREDRWSEHFIWTVDGLRILGSTSVGRATDIRLDLNDDVHDEGAILNARWIWAQGGWHPPVEDPRKIT
jgi:hypothetical protein